MEFDIQYIRSNDGAEMCALVEQPYCVVNVLAISPPLVGLLRKRWRLLKGRAKLTEAA